VIPVLAGQKVYVEEGGVARARAIKTGIRTDSMIEVTEGLKSGDRVIRTGLLELREGTLVKPTNESSSDSGGAP
jgi:membrane fusion protein (multidrug efflux system)